MKISNKKIWFVTGSQDLYGDDVLRQVAEDAGKMVDELNAKAGLPLEIVWKPTVRSSEEILNTCVGANSAADCVGIITWMHTFSPAKMWIGGLKVLAKPLLHLHTQFNREIPWGEIDMDFMNLNQSAHGDREFGHIVSRMRLGVKVAAGYWQDRDVQDRMAVWMRVANAWDDARDMKVARFGDNMNNVAVTDGDKVEAELRLGYHVDYYPIGDLAAYVEKVTEARIRDMLAVYDKEYLLAPNAREGGKDRKSVVEAARTEVAMRAFLTERKIKAITTNFDALHGLHQLPGLACQRLMADGYGFGGEGDWKTAALLRTMKVMALGLKGGTSFMEDYTYHMKQGKMSALQAHMLEVCPSIAESKPKLEVHPLGIGGKADPARLVFNTPPGPGVAATVVDMGNRFRMIVNEVEVISTESPLPKLPVAQALWIPQPDLQTSAHAWILAGGTHHTGFSMALTPEYFEDYAEIAGIEYLPIDKRTTIRDFKRDIRVNEVYYMLKKQ
ncbi:MAG: L-arabinose isomerase [Rikenellaceae bacterium]|jgi:L-arabinose isomerase|nr:L-arabinose isomerase [Rikenellaceae bacterium]